MKFELIIDLYFGVLFLLFFIVALWICGACSKPQNKSLRSSTPDTVASPFVTHHNVPQTAGPIVNLDDIPQPTNVTSSAKSGSGSSKTIEVFEFQKIPKQSPSGSLVSAESFVVFQTKSQKSSRQIDQVSNSKQIRTSQVSPEPSANPRVSEYNLWNESSTAMNPKTERSLTGVGSLRRSDIGIGTANTNTTPSNSTSVR